MKIKENPLKILTPVECDCSKCEIMCERPCWGTPEDIKKIIDSGLGDRLMIDFWVGEIQGGPESFDGDIEILCPALKNYEGRSAPFWPQNQEGCTFWNEDFKCDLHRSGLKPSEGKLSIHDMKHLFDIDLFDIDLHEAVAMTWNTEEGRSLVSEWKSIYYSTE